MRNRVFRRIAAAAICTAMALGSFGTAFAETDTEQALGIKYAEDQTLHLLYSSECTTLHPFTNGTAADWQTISNCVAGLITKDQYGNYVPDMAESYEMSEDGLVYTFHLRQGMTWSDVNGEVQGEVKAQDFVTSAQWICDPANASGSAYYYQDIIAGATALLSGETTDTSTLGFKALDDYTVEITLEKPLPYFLAYCGSYMPLPTEFFNEMGASYGLDNESILYCGPYILTTYEPQTQKIYEKNENYWDKDNVFITKIVKTYNAEGNTLAPEMFLRGDIDYADISTDILDEWMAREDTKDIVVPGLPDTTYMYYYGFCFNPTFDEEYEPENWNLAVNNENFRQSLYWGLNRTKAKLTADPYNAEMFLTNSITPKTWCNVDGVDFTNIGAMQEITARENWSFDEAKALEYKEKAVEELTAAGATFPVTLYMPYNPAVLNWDKEVQVVKQQLEELLGTDYIQCVIEAGPSTGFLSDVRRTGAYGFMKLNNGATIDDPNAWTIAFADQNTWNFMYMSTNEETQAIVQEYYALVEKAQSITEKSMERYEAFAEAEAFLLNHAMVIPYSADTTGYHVTRTNPFQAIYGADERYKYMHVLEEPLTSEQYDVLYEEWQKEQAESIK